VHDRRVAPQPLEPVEAPLLRDEHVDNEVDVVHQDPLSAPRALDVGRATRELALEPFLDRARDRGDLAVRGPVTNQEVIGDVAQAAQVEDDDLLRLLVLRGLDAADDLRRER